MKERRLAFGSAVIGGKIYVFGGKAPVGPVSDRNLRLMSNSEVYEPKEDTWSRIRSMTTCRFGQHVTPIGEELFIYGGWTQNIPTSEGYIPGDSLAAYHPFKDKWRVVQQPYHPFEDKWRVVKPSWERPDLGVLFTGRGNVFAIQISSLDGNLGLNRLFMETHG